MWTDPIVDELHRIREERAARFNFDLDTIVADLRRVEAEWPGPKIDPPPRRPKPRPNTEPDHASTTHLSPIDS